MKKILLFIVILFTFAATASAQAVKLNLTTLNGAVTATQQTVTLTSASASSGSNVGVPIVGHYIFTADGEVMQISAVNVGGVSTVFGVIRGQNGTRPAAHATARKVATGPPSAFQSVIAPPGVDPGGPCVVGNVGFQPWINTQTGDIGWCRSSIWTITNVNPRVPNSDGNMVP